MTREGQLSVHSENILPIIKKWLYSEKEIFLRELISNAADALSKLSILIKQGKAQERENFRIDIRIKKSENVLIIEDNGIGMTEEEVENYITQIAFSGAKDFLEKYESSDGIIGQFGLGFFSSFMAAERVDLETLSYQPGSSGVFWSSSGESNYTIEPKSLTKVGTKVILHLAKDSLEFLDEEKIQTLLKKFCLFFPYPIFINDKIFATETPLYLKNPKDCKEEDYLTFYEKLYPFEEPPVFYVHLNVEVPFHLKGILYFSKQSSFLEERKGKIQLFSNRVFVSEDCKEILSDYLMMLKGVLDSSDIPLNVSRSHLQQNSQVRSLASHIAKKVLDHLEDLFKKDFSRFIQIFEDLEVTLKLGILQDEKFQGRAKHLLLWKDLSLGTTKTFDELVKMGQKIYYTHKESALLSLFQEKKIPVILSNSSIDPFLFSHLEKKENITFQRIDSGLDDFLLDVSKEKDLLDAEGKSEKVRIEEFIKNCLSDEKNLLVQVKSIADQKIFGWILSEEKERRMEEYFSLTSKGTMPFTPTKTFVVNSNHAVIEKAFQLQEKEPTLAKKIIEHLYSLVKFSEKEDTKKFVSDSLEILKLLLEKQ